MWKAGRQGHRTFVLRHVYSIPTVTTASNSRMVANAVAGQCSGWTVQQLDSFTWDSGSDTNEGYEREHQIEEVSAVAT
jgi:hypothetical protein